MKTRNQRPSEPQWDQLFATAEAQEGHFTTAQAAEAGYSSQLLGKYKKSGRIVRVRRGIYRVVHFPSGDHEDLVVIWLWSKREGVFSHETALALHELSDALPQKVHLTVPDTWRSRRMLVPPQVALHHSDIEEADGAWAGSVRVTSPARTVIDCARDQVAPGLVRQAIDQGIQRGLFTAAQVEPASECLRPFEEERP